MGLVDLAHHVDLEGVTGRPAFRLALPAQVEGHGVAAPHQVDARLVDAAQGLVARDELPGPGAVGDLVGLPASEASTKEGAGGELVVEVGTLWVRVERTRGRTRRLPR